jgi:hypothetical protein
MVTVLQADNRLQYDVLLLTQRININACNKISECHYDFIEIDPIYYKNKNIDIKTGKIFLISDYLEKCTDDILIFLDSDAWIQNPVILDKIIKDLLNNPTKNGCFSRDPYIAHNTFINSGSFVLKVNDYTKNMYKTIINNFNNNHDYANKWPHDQYYISNYVFEHKEDFFIFHPEVMNTPNGNVIRHNWWKNEKMYKDISHLHNTNFNEKNNIEFNYLDYIDAEPFPNLNVYGYEYK